MRRVKTRLWLAVFVVALGGCSTCAPGTPPVETLDAAGVSTTGDGGQNNTGQDGSVPDASTTDGAIATDAGQGADGGGDVDGSAGDAAVTDAAVSDAGDDAGAFDAGSSDAAAGDAATADAAVSDAGTTDAAVTDAAESDAATPDASSPDAASTDAGSDAGASDAAVPDAASSDSGTVTNQPPVVSAGPDADAFVDATVTLTGAASDPDLDFLTTTWTQLSGPSVTLSNAGTLSPSFSANVASGSALVFQLEACDPSNACTRDTVTITVVATAPLGTHVAVPPTGSDTAGDGSTANPWATINKAIQVATASVGVAQLSRVFVSAGTYDEDITMVEGVSIVGGYESTNWTRDVVANVTRIRTNTPTGVIYAAGGTYALPTVLDGVTLEVDTNNLAAADIATLTIEEGSPTIRDVIVRQVTAAQMSIGIRVRPTAAAADVTLDNVTIEGGHVINTDGWVLGLSVNGTQASATATATALTVNHVVPENRLHFGVDLTNATGNFDGAQITIAPVQTPVAIAIDAICGLAAANGSVLSLRSSNIDPGGGAAVMGGVCVDSNARATISDSTLLGGDAVAAPDALSVSAALSVRNNATASVMRTNLKGGQVSIGNGAIHLSMGLNVEGAGRVDVSDCALDAGDGDVGVGARISAGTQVLIERSSVNTGNNNASCSNSRICMGVFVEGRAPGMSVGQLTPVAPEFTCCDPVVHGVVIENSVVRGGNGMQSFGVRLQASASQTPGTCINASTIDAGDCASIIGNCTGVDTGNTALFMMQNSTVYGGTGSQTLGLRLTPNNEPQVANNYVHAGDPLAASIGSQSTGLFLVNGRTGTGSRILNNIISGGGGSTRYAVIEENHNADPARFQNNNLFMPPTGGTLKNVLYRNCTPSNCSQEITTIDEVNTQLTGNGQNTLGSGGCISDASCMVNARPRGGDVHQANASLCVDAGVERNSSCNICQTPWVDAFGTHRLSQGWTVQPGPCSQNGPLMSGDGMPDIGPAEL